VLRRGWKGARGEKKRNGGGQNQMRLGKRGFTRIWAEMRQAAKKEKTVLPTMPSKAKKVKGVRLNRMGEKLEIAGKTRVIC